MAHKPKESKRFQKFPKDSKKIQKYPKESKRFQKIDSESALITDGDHIRLISPPLPPLQESKNVVLARAQIA